MFDNLLIMLKELGACNSFGIKPIDEWPKFYEFNILELEELASRIPDTLINTFVDGELLEQEDIINYYKVHKLSVFLNEVFDGNLHNKLTYR